MGYNVDRTAVLRFDNTAFAGMEITIRLGLPLGRVLEMDVLDEKPTDLAGLERYVGFLAPLIVSWNLERNGEPIPLTPEGVASLDWQIILAIAGAWQEAAVTLPAPLGEQSESGGASKEPKE